MAPFRKGTSGNPKGAPQKPVDQRRRRLVTTVAPATLTALERRAAAAARRSIGAVIDALVDAAERDDRQIT